MIFFVAARALAEQLCRDVYALCFKFFQYFLKICLGIHKARVIVRAHFVQHFRLCRDTVDGRAARDRTDVECRFRAACGNFVLIELRDDGRKALNGVYVSEIDKRVTACGLHCDLVAQRADRHADDAVKVAVK